jgi:uncharacterized protein with gpF-like domain
MGFHGSFNVAFREMSDYFAGKVLKLPSESYRDIQRSAHAKAFVIAGVTKAEMLEDVFLNIQRNIDNGYGYDRFRRDFRKAMVRRGWLPEDKSGITPPLVNKDEIIKKLQDGSMKLTNLPKSYQKYLGWRTSLIYRTNMHTAYMAGRWEQIQNTKEGLPYLRYAHAYYGVPENPREEHEAWDGKILPVDDVWWEAHYPPNGWNCNCGVVQISAEEAGKSLGVNLDNPSQNLREIWNEQRRIGGGASNDPKKSGVGKGWNYNVGMNDATGEKSVLEHLQRMIDRGGEYRKLGEKAFSYLKEHSAEIYKNSLDVWVEDIYNGNYTAGKEQRAIAIVDSGLVMASRNRVEHSVGTRKEDGRVSKEDAKRIPQLIAKAEKVRFNKKDNTYYYITGDITVVVRGNELRTVEKERR